MVIRPAGKRALEPPQQKRGSYAARPRAAIFSLTPQIKDTTPDGLSFRGMAVPTTLPWPQRRLGVCGFWKYVQHIRQSHRPRLHWVELLFCFRGRFDCLRNHPVLRKELGILRDIQGIQKTEYIQCKKSKRIQIKISGKINRIHRAIEVKNYEMR